MSAIPWCVWCPCQLAGFCSPGWTLGKADLSSSKVKQQPSRAAKHEAGKSHSKVWERWGRHNSGLSQRGVSWVALSQPEGWPRADRTASAHSCLSQTAKSPARDRPCTEKTSSPGSSGRLRWEQSKYLEQVLVAASLALKKTYLKSLKVPSLDWVMLPNCGAGKETAFFSSERECKIQLAMSYGVPQWYSGCTYFNNWGNWVIDTKLIKKQVFKSSCCFTIWYHGKYSWSHFS